MGNAQTKPALQLTQDPDAQDSQTGRRPWLKFYPADWLSDQALSRCSLAAQGLWIRLIAAMHQAEPYGHLPLEGLDSEAVEVGRLAGCGPEEAARLIHELEARRVFGRDDGNRIFSRRMVRDNERSTYGAENARKRWEGHSGPHPMGTPMGTPMGGPMGTPIARARARAQASESRSQKLEDTDTPPSPLARGAKDSSKAGRKRRQGSWQETLERAEYATLRESAAWRAAWDRWLAYLSERRRIHPRSIQAARIFNHAIELGVAAHTDAIDTSIRSGWAGIHAGNGGGHASRDGRDFVDRAIEKFGTDS